MTAPFLTTPIFTGGGIDFDLGGGERLKIKPHPDSTGGPSIDFTVPTEGYSLVSIDGIDTLRWAGSEPKLVLNVPVLIFGIGEIGKAALFGTHALTANRSIAIPNKSGTMAMLDDTHTDQQFISGFGFTSTASSVNIMAGSAYVPDAGRVIDYPGGTYTYPGTIPNNTMIHFYLNTVGQVEVSTLSPVVYYGTARQRSGSSARRYLFSIRSKPSGNQLYIQRGVPMGNVVDVTFLHNTGSESALLISGVAETPTDVSAAGFAPAGPTTDLTVRVFNSGDSSTVRVYAYTGSGFTVWTNIPVTSELLVMSVPCDGTPKIQYDKVGVGAASIALYGYRMQR